MATRVVDKDYGVPHDYFGRPIRPGQRVFYFGVRARTLRYGTRIVTRIDHRGAVWGCRDPNAREGGYEADDSAQEEAGRVPGRKESRLMNHDRLIIHPQDA
jgi:hypothetical protein